MNPHRFTWSYQLFPVAQIAAIAIIVGMIYNKKSIKLPLEREIFIIIFLSLLFTLNTIFAMFPELAWIAWRDTMKIIVFSILTVLLIESKEKLRYLLWVITLSFGFFCIKALPWAIATGGSYLFLGPEGSSIGANNAIAMALNMVIPLMFFLAKTETNIWFRGIFVVAGFSSIIAVILTYSRGGLLALLAVFFMFIVKSKRKFVALITIFSIVAVVFMYSPQKWIERVQTIQNYENDKSVLQRFKTWEFAWELALSRPLTGGGFEAFRANPSDFDAHNNYFGILAEQGFIVLIAYLILIGSCWLSLSKIKREFKDFKRLRWYSDCASTLQISIVAYVINGISLNKQYFETFYLIVAIVVIIKIITKNKMNLINRKNYIEDLSGSGKT
jgi:probable O-glycosylation ligase (exosortase A-associated)